MRVYVNALVFGLLCGLAAVGCGDDEGPNPADAPAIDASFDAAIDASTAARCQELCSCQATYCAGDMNACLTACTDLAGTVRECRIEHCGYAQTNPSYHCPHVAGDGEAAGTPPACIAN